MAYPAVQNFVGYPISVGGKRLAVSPNGHAGPASYTVVSSPTAGGDFVRASEFGLKYIDFVSSGGNGTHRVEATNPTKGPAQNVQLKWIVVATGAEVAGAVDLSTSRVSLLVIGE